MKKILLLAILFVSTMSFAQDCPTFEQDQSNPYYLLFTSSSAVSVQSPITINGLNFVDAGSWSDLDNGQIVYYTSFTGTTGQPLDLSNFTIQLNGQSCSYPQQTLSTPTFTSNTVPKDVDIKVHNYLGQYLKTIQSHQMYDLPSGAYVFMIDGYQNQVIGIK